MTREPLIADERPREDHVAVGRGIELCYDS
ncbi:MAG: hypothetical protein QOF88_5812, partial [Mycobacterium sp.]|nr:hypothetical protein [Mycobacterium sp.]